MYNGVQYMYLFYLEHEVISAAVKAFQSDDWLEDSDRGTGDTLSERREGTPCAEATYVLMRELKDNPLHGFYDFGAGHLQHSMNPGCSGAWLST